jgi:hypothetical protein
LTDSHHYRELREVPVIVIVAVPYVAFGHQEVYDAASRLEAQFKESIIYFDATEY